MVKYYGATPLSSARKGEDAIASELGEGEGSKDKGSGLKGGWVGEGMILRDRWVTGASHIQNHIPAQKNFARPVLLTVGLFYYILLSLL